MKHLKRLFIIAVVSLCVTACSETLKIQKQLIGTWVNTQTVTITTVNGTSTSPVILTSSTETTFDKGGTGCGSNSGSGVNPFPKEFTWTNLDSELTIIDQDTFVPYTYTVVEHSKSQLILNSVTTGVVSSDTITVDITITLDKV
ncbi:MAG: hypothetical protein IIA45_09000 [Bacteroidetes bacterium]|nr:hypothetical protein [Bacteroidota bacterium]